MIDRERLLQSSTDEMLKHRHQKILLSIGIPDACVLVSQLQLAIRHPNNPAAATTRHHCDAIIGQVERISQDLANFLKLGYDPNWDERWPK